MTLFRISLAILLTLTACATPSTQDSSVTDAALGDEDFDTVSDEYDECAQTRMPQPVDATGCPVFQGVLPNVDFPANSADLGRDARNSLDELVVQLKAHPTVVVTVDSHTDNRGSGIRNLDLSKQRVLAVVRFLVARGVNPRQLRPFAYGESRPTVSNASAQGREQNRRIEISVIFPSSVPLVAPEEALPAEQTASASPDAPAVSGQ